MSYDQQRAIEKYREASASWGYNWNDEWLDSLQKFCNVLDINLKDWSVGIWGHSFVSWEYDNSDWLYLDSDPLDEMKGIRLRTWIINNWMPEFWQGKWYSRAWDSKNRVLNSSKSGKSRHSKITGDHLNCPLTGFCADNELIYPLVKFIETPDDTVSLRNLIDDCFHEFVSAWIRDMEDQDSDDYIRETIEANEYEFYAGGSMV